MLLVPTLLAFVGLTLSALVLTLVLRGSLASMSPATWEDKWVSASFITFAWHELGRGLFLGLVGALGLAPLTIAFFAGSEREYSNILFLTLLSWAAFSAGIFLIGIASGLIGFIRYEAGNPERHSFMNLAQLAVVAVAAFPVAVVFLTYLMPSLSHVVGLWLDTMSLYAELAS